MDTDFVRNRYGNVLDLGACSLGHNLNLVTCRGYASLDKLSVVSSPDVYDQVNNPNGTQRDLNPKHAKDCLDYALDSVDLAPEESPRYFPEVILNARDASVVEIYDPENPEHILDVDSFAEEIEHAIVGLRIRVGDLEFPKPLVSPQISRVDGNHRLNGTDDLLEMLAAGDVDDEFPDEFPTVSFSILLSLSALQEASLFRDINGEHQGMEVAHLSTLTLRTGDSDEMRDDPKTRPLWLANELTKSDKAFSGKVFFGGAKTGLKEAGPMPPLKINSLKTTIHQQIQSAPGVDVAFKDEPEATLELIDRYWKAVATVFPEAWNDKSGYILLQSIGLGAFARLGGHLIDQALESGEMDQEHFEQQLKVVRNAVPLERSAWKGIAGAGGQKVVADALREAANPDAAKLAKIKNQLVGELTIDEKLGASESGLPAEPVE